MSNRVNGIMTELLAMAHTTTRAIASSGQAQPRERRNIQWFLADHKKTFLTLSTCSGRYFGWARIVALRSLPACQYPLIYLRL